MDLEFAPARALAGEVRVPGDKSVTHRAYILSALAGGTTTVTGANTGADCEATLGALAALGARVDRGEPGIVRITGSPGGFAPPLGDLDLGNSGTGLRLLTGALCGALGSGAATLTGDASLRGRPMRRVVEPLAAMGADVAALGPGGTPPLEVRAAPGRLRGRTHALAVSSAQVKSSILLAGLFAAGETAVEEPLPSRDHTERMLPAFGVPVRRAAPNRCALDGKARLVSPGALAVPGDFSAAFFWLVAGTIVPEGELVLRGVGLNPGRTGGLTVLQRMGARIEVSNARIEAGEPVGDLTVHPARLTASGVRPAEIPALVDELPALAIAQAYASGVSRVRGAGELRVKESDRIRAVVNALKALGGIVDEVEDGWDVTGGPLSGGVVESRGDHRIAMAFGIAALGAFGPVRVREGEMIDTSYPRFYSDLRDRVTSR